MSDQAEAPWWFIFVVGDGVLCGRTHYFRLISHEQMEIESQSRNENRRYEILFFAKLNVAFNPAGLVVPKLNRNVGHS